LEGVERSRKKQMPNNDALIKTVGNNIQEIYSKLIEKNI
jgi:hypothetical protein